MTIKEFNNKYKLIGGIKQLSIMRENYESLDRIAFTFRVSKERARQWMVEFFGERYDPRTKRRERRIEAMKKVIKKHGVEKTKELYPGINRYYLREAIKQIKYEQKN
jgi:hypothetical protein